MVDPITIAIATALGAGLSQVSKAIVEKGLVEPALKPFVDKMAQRVTSGYEQAKEDKALQEAVNNALEAVGAPQDPDKFTQYLLKWGFDLLRAESNDALRREIAQAALLQTSPDPVLVPDRLVRSLRMPLDSRPLLADFLYHLREQLKAHKTWGVLVEQTRQEATHTYLQRMAHDIHLVAGTAERFSHYFQILLSYYDLHADKPDGQALQEYLEHLMSEYQHISFVLTKARRRERLASEAELDAVFVPLHVQDWDSISRTQTQEDDNPTLLVHEEYASPQLLTINDILTKYPNFLLKGPPGSGKTTLLRHLTMSFARGDAAEKLDWKGDPLLPILVPLRNFGRFLAQNASRYTNPAPQALREFIADYFAEHDLELPPDFFHERLKQGRCLVLLDGLDEIADRNLRAQVAQYVNQFVKRYAGKGNYFGLASRPRGYEQVKPYLKRLAVCEVQPLTPEDRDRLVANLLHELEPNPRIYRQNTHDLITDIRRKEKVDTLSRNPLFCTTLVLVFKYQGATLPERRVDVYQELVNLMLGFWETHKVDREGVADVHELVLLDGTGRNFLDEREAVEAKERALKYLAGWMQAEGLTDIPRVAATAQLAAYFANYEGAGPTEKEAWAKNFLDVAHQRSGLFVEFDTGVYAFSHKSFLEYLAATDLLDRLDREILQIVLEHAADLSWEETILLAFAHERLSAPRRQLLLDNLSREGHTLLAGRCMVDAGARLPIPLRRQVQQALYNQMIDGGLEPKLRYAAGELLDESGWLPEDLNTWIHCPGCGDDRRDLWAAKYPVTNAQFALFVEAGGYDNPNYWGGEAGEGWQWRQLESRPIENKTTSEPVYWRNVRFGKERHGYPVVGVSWYEAVAYSKWLTDVLHRAYNKATDLSLYEMALVSDLLEGEVSVVRLPTETEWIRLVGGEQGERYPWDKRGHSATKAAEEVIPRANVSESGIRNTSPITMYPEGASVPFDLWDVAGNVWEWTGSWYDKKLKRRVVRGGSWFDLSRAACASIRNYYNPDFAYKYLGFRVVASFDSSP